MVAITSLFTATMGLLATAASAAPATPASDHRLEARYGLTPELFLAITRYVQENPGAYIFGINGWRDYWWFEENMKGFAGGNCHKSPDGSVMSGTLRPARTMWVCHGGGWFPNYQQAEKEGLNRVCPDANGCGVNDGGLWGN
ncbi:hypothetical protein A1Q2_05823 [Trichosporon asahii var. asahii CBS 8904]|uniref:Secreted protein n=1 Tax=Trichosporon asahii var. asahii (strain CBS 8904) TaxID=1220162 RepID=K1WE19_TRIAC|nr:hypothetical protein A1Q2_05823 [Trichosporon asahii var. asahii CBS 8904]